MIELQNLSKIYLENKNNTFHALDNINLTINSGELIAITGESGAGKSTLLHILSCIETFSGEYLLDNWSVSKANDKKLSKIRSSKISIVLQDFALINDLTVYENVILPLYFNHDIKNKRKTVLNVLDRVGIIELKNKKTYKLSGGQKQRVAIARALVTNPNYLFADEPTGSLDTKTSQEIISVFKALNKDGITVVIVTHSLSVAKQCNRIIELKDGKILRDIMINKEVS